jgi:hypothetical protein
MTIPFLMYPRIVEVYMSDRNYWYGVYTSDDECSVEATWTRNLFSSTLFSYHDISSQSYRWCNQCNINIDLLAFVKYTLVWLNYVESWCSSLYFVSHISIRHVWYCQNWSVLLCVVTLREESQLSFWVYLYDLWSTIKIQFNINANLRFMWNLIRIRILYLLGFRHLSILNNYN